MQPQSNVEALKKSPKRKIPKWLKVTGIIIVALIAIFITLYTAVNISTEEPKKISDQLVSNIQSGDSRSIYALTGKAFRDSSTESDIEQMVRKVSPLLQGDSSIVGRSIGKSSNSLDMAAIVYEIKTSSGSRYIKVLLQKSGDDWQVFSFNTSDTQPNSRIE